MSGDAIAANQGGSVLLAGVYAFVREVGQGAIGRVVLVRDVRAATEGGEALFAAKIVSASHARRLLWERDVLGRVRHPRLCEVRELFEVGAALGAPFRLRTGDVVLLETWVEGRASDAALAGLAPPERASVAATLAADVASALAALHDAGIVHGDVKPANVVVEGDLAQATLVDLGLAGAPGERAGLEGTPAYLAPEALSGARSAATDLYALGATLFDWLDGGAVVAGASRTASEPHEAALWPHAPERRSLPAFVPAPLRALVLELLSASPLERPRSAREVERRLRAESGQVLSTEAVLEAPSPADRALCAGTAPLVGRDAELRALVAALESTGVVRLEGPSGAGKTRLFSEAARAHQAACAARGVPIPRVHEAPELGDASRGASAVVLVTAELDEADAWARVRAAELCSERLVVVLERARGHEASTRSIELSALGRPEVATLLGHLIPGAPLRASSLDAALRASHGLPGRLVRGVVLAWAAGDDPSAPSVLERHVAADPRVAWPVELEATRRALAIAGGSLDASLGLAAGVELGAGRRLVALGLASFDGARLGVRDAEARAIRAEAATRADRALAERIARAARRAEERAYAWLVLDPVRGESEALRALGELRARGDVDAAARLGATALEEAPGASLALLSETMDALRAAGDLPSAVALAVGKDDPDVLALGAELERLSGSRDRAEALARRAGPVARALVVRARLRLDAGDRAGAEALASEALAEGELRHDLLARARALETLALAAQSVSARDEHARRLERMLALLDAEVGLPVHARLGARARIASVLGTLAAGAGRMAAAAALHTESAELAVELGERAAAARFAANVGIASLDLGRLGPAIDALAQAARRMTLAREEAGLGRVLYNLANAASSAGDFGRADVLSRRAIETCERTGDAPCEALCRVVRADVELALGRPLVACAELERALGAPLAASEQGVVESRLAIVLGSLGRGTEARARSRAALALGSASEVAALEAETAAGRVELALGALDAALVHATAAMRRAEGGAYEGRTRSLQLLADVMEAQRRPDEARATLAELARLLDAALRSLPPAGQAKMRVHPAHLRALAVVPALALPGDAGTGEGQTVGLRVVRAAAAIAREDRPRRVMEALAAAALELSAAERAFVVERSDGGLLFVRTGRGGAGPLPASERPSLSVASRALDRREPVRTTDALADLALSDAESVHAMALRSVLAIPIPSAGDATLRVLVLDDRVRPGAFSPRVTEALTALSELAGIALARAEALRADRLDLGRARRRERSLVRRLDAERARGAEGDGALPAVVARSAPMRAALEVVHRAAPSMLPVLLVGESGTGKELCARTLAARSAAAGPFVVASASALPESLLESALFGHVRGAFTGADRAHRGLFELADGGTLFLDEIGDTSAALQAKLLRVLESGELRPVGATRSRRVAVRLVCATRHDLEALVRAGTFREDLYWRIAVVTVRVPPLRERPEDLPALVGALLERHAEDAVPRVAPEALAALGRHAWPGNVRELENELRRALLALPDGAGPIRLEHLSPALRGDDAAPETLSLRTHVEALERRLVRRALEVSGQNQTHAARALGVSRFGLSKMMARLGLARGQ